MVPTKFLPLPSYILNVRCLTTKGELVNVNMFRIRISDNHNVEKMLQPIKSTFWEKWTSRLKSLNSTIYAQQHSGILEKVNYFQKRTLGIHIKTYFWSFLDYHYLKKYFYNWNITLNYCFVYKIKIRSCLIRKYPF